MAILTCYHGGDIPNPYIILQCSIYHPHQPIPNLTHMLSTISTVTPVPTLNHPGLQEGSGLVAWVEEGRGRREEEKEEGGRTEEEGGRREKAGGGRREEEG